MAATGRSRVGQHRVRRFSARAAVAAVSVALAIPAAPVQAAPPTRSTEDDLPRAKELFVQGHREYDLGHYPEALALFERAYKLKPIPELLYNIGQCYRLLGNLQQARRLYLNFLSVAPEAGHGTARETAKEMLAEVEKALQAQADASAKPPTSVVNPERQVATAGSLDKALQDTLEPPSAPVSPDKKQAAPTARIDQPDKRPGQPAPITALSTTPPPAPHSNAARVTGWTLLGVSAVAAGAGTLFGLGARSSADDQAAATDNASWQSAKSDAQSKATLATVSWISAGVLAAAALATLAISYR